MSNIQRLTELPPETLEVIRQNTFNKRAPLGLENARKNVPFIERSVLELPRTRETAVVIAAGPSLARQRIIERLLPLRDRICVVATDGALPACLRQGLVPDVVVSLDPHPTRIVRWFGDPERVSAGDDYFRRQDLDEYLRVEEWKKNDELVKMVNAHGPSMCAALATSVDQSVTQRCISAGMPRYWWNPVLDDWDDPQSMTRELHRVTGKIPCLSALGHTGGACWVISHAVLECTKVAIVGMDLGYPEGTSVVNTQYYEVVRDLPLEQAETLLLSVTNPHTQTSYLTDPVYFWYRQGMLEAVPQAECRTANCSGEGILFGEGIEWTTLEEFI